MRQKKRRRERREEIARQRAREADTPRTGHGSASVIRAIRWRSAWYISQKQYEYHFYNNKIVVKVESAIIPPCAAHISEGILGKIRRRRVTEYTPTACITIENNTAEHDTVIADSYMSPAQHRSRQTRAVGSRL